MSVTDLERKLAKSREKTRKLAAQVDIERHEQRLQEQALKEVAARALAMQLRALPTGTVIQFQHQFRTSERVYTYAAIKATELWFLTGTTQQPKSALSLAQFIGDQRAWVLSPSARVV